jgi:hypothetical protein
MTWFGKAARDRRMGPRESRDVEIVFRGLGVEESQILARGPNLSRFAKLCHVTRAGPSTDHVPFSRPVARAPHGRTCGKRRRPLSLASAWPTTLTRSPTL